LPTTVKSGQEVLRKTTASLGASNRLCFLFSTIFGVFAVKPVSDKSFAPKAWLSHDLYIKHYAKWFHQQIL
jgi:hypothetical protein